MRTSPTGLPPNGEKQTFKTFKHNDTNSTALSLAAQGLHNCPFGRCGAVAVALVVALPPRNRPHSGGGVQVILRVASSVWSFRSDSG